MDRSGGWTAGVWKNGKRTLKGEWVYIWARDVFRIRLDSVDRITGEERDFLVYDDTPEWGNWKLLRKA